MAVLVLSGQVTVTTAGSEVPVTTAGTAGPGTFLLKAMGGNTDTLYVGNDGAGAVTSSNGYPLAALDQIIVTVTDLSELRLDATTINQVLAWFKIAGQNVGVDAPAA